MERDLGATAEASMEQKNPFPRTDRLTRTDVARVSLTMDISCDLSNASHFDIHDAAPGFAVWTETVPGAAKNWFFVLPNVYGVETRGSNHRRQFAGVAIRLTHGVGISWDGRRIRHCTSIFDPGVPENHVFGTFCAPKVRVLDFAHCRRVAGQAYPPRTGFDFGQHPERTADVRNENELSHVHNDMMKNIRIPRKRNGPTPSV
jgi:hypothetical protein